MNKDEQNFNPNLKNQSDLKKQKPESRNEPEKKPLPGSEDLKAVNDLHSKIYAPDNIQDLKKPLGPQEFTAFNAENMPGQQKTTVKPFSPQEQSPQAPPEEHHPKDYSVHHKKKKIPGKKRNKLKILLIFFVVLSIPLLAMTGITLYKGDLYWVRDILGLGLSHDPVKAVEEVAKNMEEVKTLKSDYKADLNITIDKEKISGELEGSGKFDNTKGESKIDLTIKNVKLPESLGGSELLDDLKLEAEIISTKNELYFKSSLLEDSWYKVDLNTFINPQVLSKEKASAENFAKMATSVVYSDGFEQSGTLNLGKYVKSATKLDDEKIDGENVYHYQIEPDLVKALEESGGLESIPEFYQSIYTDLISKYITFKIDFWVSKKDLLFKKEAYNINVKFDASDFGTSGIFKFDVNFENTYKDIDKSVSIKKPDAALDFDEDMIYDLISSYSGGIPIEGSTGDVEKDTRNTQRLTDIAQIQVALEVYYAENNQYPILNDDSKDGSFLEVLKEKNYLVTISNDPSHPQYYYSYESVDGKTYSLNYINETKDGVEVKTVGPSNLGIDL